MDDRKIFYNYLNLILTNLIIYALLTSGDYKKEVTKLRAGTIALIAIIVTSLLCLIVIMGNASKNAEPNQIIQLNRQVQDYAEPKNIPLGKADSVNNKFIEPGGFLDSEGGIAAVQVNYIDVSAFVERIDAEEIKSIAYTDSNTPNGQLKRVYYASTPTALITNSQWYGVKDMHPTVSNLTIAVFEPGLFGKYGSWGDFFSTWIIICLFLLLCRGIISL